MSCSCGRVKKIKGVWEIEKTIILSFVFLLAVSSTVEGGTITLKADGSGDYPTIQAAIDDCNIGDVILLADGTYSGPGNRDIDFLGKAITVRSTDPNDPNVVAATIIDCDGTETEPHRGFRFWQDEDANSVVAGLTIINGYAPITPPHRVATGGAIDCVNSSPTIRQCVIRDNLARSGGGIFCGLSESVIKNCKVIGNRARNGGGIRLLTCLSEIKNCLITGNTAWERNGGGIFISWGDVTITNCTISNNIADRKISGGIYCNELTVTITNCIFWDNSPSGITEGPGGNATATYCDIQGGWPGEGNIEANPRFVKPWYWDANGVWVDGDYHLLWTSPCIDTGDPNYNPEPNETDLDGHPRLLDGDENGFPIIDMGAYEYKFSSIRADVRIKPKTLNLASQGGWISCHIRLPEDYNVADIDPNTILLESEPNDIYPEWIWFEGEDKVVIAEFSRLAVQETLSDMDDVLEMGQARLTVSGELMDGTEFVGTDTIRIINNQVYKETAPNSLTFVLWSDTHYGKSKSIGEAVDWTKNKNPDFLFHLGDITHRGELDEFAGANIDFDDIIQNTNVENVWITLGAGHDGYLDQIPPSNWNGARFLRDRNLTSSWYTIKKGNNVFIFCNIIQSKNGWILDWGGPAISNFIPQNYIDWLEGQLAKWNNTKNNIWIITHCPLQHTNVYTHEWAGMQKAEWITTTAKIKNLLSKYRVDVLMNGHVHIDPDKSHSADPNASGGNVVLGTSRDDLPDKTTFLHVPSVCWKHGREKRKKSTYPAVMYFDLIEGENYFDLKAARVDTISPVNITYNDGSESLEKIRVPLSYPIEGMDGSNIDFFEQAWGVWEFSNEGNYQWYKDSEGLMTTNNSWIISRWDLWEKEIIVGFDVIWNEMGSLSHEFYCSNDNMNTWDGPYNKASDLGNCRWVEVRTMIYPSTIAYIYDMKLLVINIEAEMQLAPQTLNCNSKANFVKAHITLPEEFTPEDVDVDTPALAYPVNLESEYLEVFVNDYDLVEIEISFDREAFCSNVPDTNDGYLNVTITGSLTTGQQFTATDTIRIINKGNGKAGK